MCIEFIWQLPTGGDGHYGTTVHERRGERVPSDPSRRPRLSDAVSDPRGERFNYFDYLQQVARAADLAGFDGIQISNDPAGDESWIVAGYVARSTRRLRLLVEFEASRGSAVYAAKNAVSYQRYTGGRFAWQIGAGGSVAQRRRQGDFAADGDVAARIEEFVTVARGVLSGARYSFRGKYFEVLNGGFEGPLGGQTLPPVYLSGNSIESYRLSARIGDVHVFDALPVDELKLEIAKLTALTPHRSISLGLRIDLLARETESEALFDARRYRAQAGGAATDTATGGPFWAGFGAWPTAAKAAVVGNYPQVAAALADYAAAGIGSFILAAVPHFEEAYRVGEHVLPAARRLTASPGRDAA